jgi:organic radical activating enzyme
VETNGTHYLPAYPYNRWGVFTVVSPKTPKIAPNLILHVDALKYVLEAGHVDPDDGLPTSVLGNGLRPFRPWEEIILVGRVYVQPADCQDPERNAANRLAAVESCLRFGYRLGSQLHKVVGLD